MKSLTSLYLSIVATGRAPLFVKLAVVSLGVAGALLGADTGSVFASSGDDGGGW